MWFHFVFYHFLRKAYNVHSFIQQIFIKNLLFLGTVLGIESWLWNHWPLWRERECVCARMWAQSYLALCDLMDYSPQGSFVHGILQARKLKWVVIPFSRGSSWPGDWTQVSCTAGRVFTVWATRETHMESIVVVQSLSVSDSLGPHELQHTRLLCPSLSPWVCSNSCPLSQWCHTTISSSVIHFSSIIPSIGVFSTESALHIRWPKYWNFSFSINPSNEHSRFISSRRAYVKKKIWPHSVACEILVPQPRIEPVPRNWKVEF